MARAAPLAAALVALALCAPAAAVVTAQVDVGGALAAVTGYGPREIYAQFNASAYLALGETAADLFDEAWPVPPGNHPFNHFFFAYNPMGHPAVDGFGGGFGTPHVDLHAFMITPEERQTKAQCSSFPPCPEDEVSEAIYNFPPAALIADNFFLDTTYGGHGVPNHGMHWLWKGDLPVITPLHTGTEPDMGPPGWLPCLQQASGAPDAGCRLADWYPGITPILITLDGRTAAHEAMFTKDFVRRLRSGRIENPFRLGYPQVERRITDASPPKYPSTIVAEYYPETDMVRITLELIEYDQAACPKNCKKCNDNFECEKCNRGRALWRNMCVRCSPLDMVKVNGQCIEQQSCALMENGGWCQAGDGECLLHANGTPVPCQEEEGCSIIDARCTACDLKYKSECTACSEGYAPNNAGRKCLPAGL